MHQTTEHDPGKLQWRDMPYRGRVLRDWFVALVVMIGVITGIGLLVVGPLDASVGNLDRDVSAMMGQIRTPGWDDSTHVGSLSADSLVKIPAVIILSGLFLWRWKRWKEAALLVGALALETAAFVVASFVVDRPRPAIEQLDSIPPTGAFPSGHTGAAVAFYGALAVILFWRTRNRVARFVATTVAVVLPPIVGFSRLYRGMHSLSDVFIGSLVGLAALIIVYSLLSREAP